MKKILQIILLIFCFLPIWVVDAADNVPIWAGSSTTGGNNKYLNELSSSDDIKAWNAWERWVVDLLFAIAKDFKTVMYMVAWIAFIIIAIKLVIAEDTDAEVTNFKKWIIWITLWIIVMQLAYFYVNSVYDREFWWALWERVTEDIIQPLILVLETAAAFLFILVAIYAFFRTITANWDEQKISQWRWSIVYALIWFVVVKLAAIIVHAVYWTINCQYSTWGWIFQWSWNKCLPDSNLSWVFDIIVRVINWMNSLVWIAVILMIIYAWVNVLFGNWDEEKFAKAKRTVIYVFIGIAILAFNYFIMSFFILPEVAI